MNDQNTITANLPKIVEKDPIGGSIISKLNAIRSDNPSDPRLYNATSISYNINEKIRSNDTIVQLFPDIELCIQILVSSIISPNDMTTSKLNYIPPKIRLKNNIKTTLAETIKDHITKYYELDKKLQIILREALFTKGSYIEAIIPEASLDDVISQYGYTGNVSLEALEKLIPNPTVYLGVNNTKLTVSNEELNSMYKSSDGFDKIRVVKKDIEITQEDLNISITDDIRILNLNSYLVKNVKKEASRKINNKSLTIEENNDYAELNKFFRPADSYKQQNYIEISTIDAASRKSFGRPLVFKLPVEAVIPVHVVNDPKSHLGYYVLLDQNGGPVKIDQNMFTMDDTQVVNINTYEQKLSLVEKAAAGLEGMTKKDVTLDNLEEIYSKLVERMLKDKLKKGLYGDLVDIKDNIDVYRVMLYRALRSQQTKVLFLPADLVSFYAFDYRDNGTGKSLMEKAAVLYSIRSIAFFSRIMAYIKNNTTITTVSATLDENDTDPVSKMEMVMSEALKTRQTQFPLGIGMVRDLTDWVQRSGLVFKFNHPGLPNYDITREDSNVSKIVPDEELDKTIQEYIIMSFGLTPEIVQAGYSTDYATTVVAKNLLLAKRVMQTQNAFTPQLTEHVRKIIANDMMLQDSLKNIIKNNLADIKSTLKKAKSENSDIKLDKISDKNLIEYILDTYAKEIVVDLPKPDTYDSDNMKADYDNYKSVVEDLVDTLYPTDALPEEMVGALSGKVDTIKSIIKSTMVREWVNKNNWFPELINFNTKDDDGKPVFNILSEHEAFINNISETLLPFLKTRYKEKSKMDQKLQKVEESNSGSSGDYGNQDEADNGSDDNYDNNDDTGDGEEGADDMGNMDGDNEGGEEDTGGADGEGDTGGTEDDDNADDMGEGDMDLDVGDDGESKSGKKQETKTDKDLKEAKIETEKAKAEKVKADAELQKAKADKLESGESKVTNDGRIAKNSKDDEEDDKDKDDDEESNEDVIKQPSNPNRHPQSLRRRFRTSTFVYN